MRSEKLYYTNIEDKTLNKLTGKVSSLKNTILNIMTEKGQRLFTGVEQGDPYGRFDTETFVIFYPSMQREVQKWLEKSWGTTVMLVGKEQTYYTYTASQVPLVDTEYEQFL